VIYIFTNASSACCCMGVGCGLVFLDDISVSLSNTEFGVVGSGVDRFSFVGVGVGVGVVRFGVGVGVSTDVGAGVGLDVDIVGLGAGVVGLDVEVVRLCVVGLDFVVKLAEPVSRVPALVADIGVAKAHFEVSFHSPQIIEDELNTLNSNSINCRINPSFGNIMFLQDFTCQNACFRDILAVCMR